MLDLAGFAVNLCDLCVKQKNVAITNPYDNCVLILASCVYYNEGKAIFSHCQYPVVTTYINSILRTSN